MILLERAVGSRTWWNDRCEVPRGHGQGRRRGQSYHGVVAHLLRGRGEELRGLQLLATVQIRIRQEVEWDRLRGLLRGESDLMV